MTFTQDASPLSYNVTAVAQVDADGYGPAYTLNGVSDRGYWYQVGLSWNWPYLAGQGHVRGFSMNYQVFSNLAISIFPTTGGGGLANFTGPINQGDTVLLQLSFSGGKVSMFAYDWSTRASANETYGSKGASTFLGFTQGPSDSNGFFTGLMTEWYHSDPYIGDFGKTVYSSNVAIHSAWLWEDEYDARNGAVYFDHFPSAPSVFDSKALLNATVAGVTEYSDGYRFITGYLDKVSLNLDYTLIGTGPTNRPPTLSYVYNGSPRNASLPRPLVTFFVDPGTPWSVSSDLPGIGSFERWETRQPTSGTASSISQGASLTYYHQYSVSVTYLVSGGGSPAPPNFAFSVFGTMRSALLSSAPQTFWADEGQYSVDDPLVGSTNAERWVTALRIGPIDGAARITATYAHQYLLSVYGSGQGGGGDAASRWYDSGSIAVANASGTYSRNGGIGYRTLGYSIDGGAKVTVTPTSGVISVSVAIDAPHRVDFFSVTQYQVTLNLPGSLPMLHISPPPVDAGAYWYDSRTTVTFSGSQVWNASSGGSRLSVVGYVVGQAYHSLARRGNGTFAFSLTADSPLSISIDYATQYLLTISGGSNVSARGSPTLDNYYDSGNKLAVTTDYTWGDASGTERQSLVGYSVNGGPVQGTPRKGSGTFTTPEFTLDSPLRLTFDSATQYLVSFAFTDHSGSHAIAPSSISLRLAQIDTPYLPGDRIWFDEGTSFTVSSLLWEGVDVSPPSTVYRVNHSGLSVTFHARVYDATLKVIDYLGLPAAGATADLVLANGTRLTRVSGLDGMIRVSQIPVGTFRATASGLGASAGVLGDASTQAVAVLSVPIGYPTLGVLLVVFVLFLGSFLDLRPRKNSGQW